MKPAKGFSTSELKGFLPCETDCYAQYGGGPPCEDNVCPYDEPDAVIPIEDAACPFDEEGGVCCAPNGDCTTCLSLQRVQKLRDETEELRDEMRQEDDVEC